MGESSAMGSGIKDSEVLPSFSRLLAREADLHRFYITSHE